ncbi:phospho-sugar mutase [Opitutales bacterium]|nr:phospho-sugar mutase [Opitutales bacterium]MDA8990842.1 phospho-sugar mutase [Opitutales bacterium]
MIKENLEAAEKSKKIFPSTKANCEEYISLKSLPSWANESITELIEKECWEELNDRFYKSLSFGTGGMRGRTIGKIVTQEEKGKSSEKETPKHAAIGTNTLNEITIAKATKALFKYIEEWLSINGEFEQPRLVVAHDVRHFSPEFSKLVAITWEKLGGYAMIFDGPRSTPQLSYTVRNRQAHTGVVITASHNPYHDNGFKAYFNDGGQLVPPHAQKVVEYFNDFNLEEIVELLSTDRDLGELKLLGKEDDLSYGAVLEDAVLSPNLLSEQSVKLVFSPIHGTGGISTIPALLDHGVDVVTVKSQNQFDPNFSSVKSPNPENKEALSLSIDEAKRTKSDAVLASDPDCDRIGVAVRNEKDFVCLSGNQIACLLAEYRLISLKSKQLLKPENKDGFTLLKTFVTTSMLEKIAKEHGVNCVNTPTGFKWMAQKLNNYEDRAILGIKEKEGIGIDFDSTDLFTRIDILSRYSKYVVLAAEESYGYLPMDLVRDKDGNAASLAVAELLAYLKSLDIKPLDFLDKLYIKYGFHYEKTENIYFDGAEGSEQIIKIMKSHRKSPCEKFNGLAVSKVKDFSHSGLLDEEDQSIEKENFIMITLENGFKIAIRPSGTEPKIKFYLFGESLPNPQNISETKEKIISQINELGAFLVNDAKERAI